MKIIHTSDLHIDSPLTARLTDDKVKERRAELRSALRRLISEARTLSAGAVIIAGDLFDEGRLSLRTASFVLDTVRDAKDMVFFYLEGNHEGSALRGLGLDIPSNLLFFEDNWTYFKAEGVTVAGINRIYNGVFDSLLLPENTKNIVVLHGEVRQGKSSEGVIGLNDLIGKNIDYLALGHYHSYAAAKIDERGVAIYSGTPEGRGFDEVGEKGYVLLDTSAREIAYEFRPFAKRRLHAVKLDISAAKRTSDIEYMAEKALCNIPRNDLVRLVLCGTFREGMTKDNIGIADKFRGSFYYFELKDTSRPLIDPEDYRYDKSLKGEFIRTVLSSPELDETTKEKIISCGINALMGEELFGE